MDVFVIPVGRHDYELYCETSSSPIDAESEPSGWFGRLRHQFSVMLHAAEERRQRGVRLTDEETRTWWGRMKERMLAWAAERVAEQRLLWNLRREVETVLVHPEDLTFDETLALTRRILQRDHDRHRRWLVFESVLLLASGVLALVPGPNLIAYYFAFRVWGHWRSMSGAAQGLRRITWTGRACPHLSELRALEPLDPGERKARLVEIAVRLGLPHFAAFFERMSVRHA